MKFINFKENLEIKLGIKTEHGILDVHKAAKELKQDVPVTIADVINSGNVQALNKVVNNSQGKDDWFISEDQITYAPVVNQPEKIICVGLNYISHAEESKMDIPKSPILFNKFNNALAAHQDPIQLPSVAEKFDYEAELVIVIGKEAKDVSEDDALSYVFGYTVGNDFSARDLQFKNGQWLLGKTCDQFAPLGPYLLTADEVDPNHLDISCTVNGEVKQSANTKNMIFNCASIISYVSKHMTLKPGDLIFSGTPEGVILGYPEAEQKWLKAGDEISVSIEQLGTLTNVLK